MNNLEILFDDRTDLFDFLKAWGQHPELTGWNVVAQFKDDMENEEPHPLIDIIKNALALKPIKVGDVIPVKLANDEEIELLAVKQEEDGMIYTTVDSLKTAQPMNPTNTNEGGYEASALRKKLKEEILPLFPESIRSRMVPFENGDLLRPPTEREIFGKNEYGEEEPETVTQWEPMKLKRNRIAFLSKNGAWEWYWLMNKRKGSAASFAYVGTDGGCYYYDASYSFGVRPAFKISNHTPLWGVKETGGEQ